MCPRTQLAAFAHLEHYQSERICFTGPLQCSVLVLPAPDEPLRGNPGLVGWKFRMSGLRRCLLSSEGPVQASSSYYGKLDEVDSRMSDVILHTDFQGSVCRAVWMSVTPLIFPHHGLLRDIWRRSFHKWI